MKSIAKPRLMILFEIAVAFVAVLPALVFPACGVESPVYIESVEQGGGSIIQVELTNKATVSLPSSGSVSSYFGYWSILYRIYVSGTPISGQAQLSSSELSKINSSLANDYSSMYSYTDTTNNTIQNTNIYNIFKNHGYYEIALENVADISTVLNIFDKNLIIEFPQPAGSIPTLSITDKGSTGTVNAPTYNLLRSTGFPTDGIHDKTNDPLPSNNRYFINYDELNASANNSKTMNDGYFHNLDVADNSSAATRYTYVSLYIIALGRDTNLTWNLISSRPTFIAILRLPEKP